jgi:hypothetical protein
LRVRSFTYRLSFLNRCQGLVILTSASAIQKSTSSEAKPLLPCTVTILFTSHDSPSLYLQDLAGDSPELRALGKALLFELPPEAPSNPREITQRDRGHVLLHVLRLELVDSIRLRLIKIYHYSA